MTSADYKLVLARALRELDTFSIPEVGTLVSEVLPARVDAASGRIEPPQATVRIEASTRHLKPLYDFLADKYGLKRDQAEATAVEIGRYVLESLKVGVLDLPGAGKLVRSPKGLSFESPLSDPTLNAYGLPSTAYPGLLAGKSYPSAETVAPPAAKPSKAGKGTGSRAAEPARPEKAASKAEGKAAKATAGKSSKSSPAKGKAKPDPRAELYARAAAEGREPTARELAELEITLEEQGIVAEQAEVTKSRSGILRFTLVVTLLVLAAAGGLIYVYRDAFFAPLPPPAIPAYERTRLHQVDSMASAAADSARRDSLSRRIAPSLGADTSRRSRARVDSLQLQADELSAEADDPANATYRIIAGAYESESEAQTQASRWQGRKGFVVKVIKGGRAGGRFRLQVYESKKGSEARRRLAEAKAFGFPEAELKIEAPAQ